MPAPEYEAMQIVFQFSFCSWQIWSHFIFITHVMPMSLPGRLQDAIPCPKCDTIYLWMFIVHSMHCDMCQVNSSDIHWCTHESVDKIRRVVPEAKSISRAGTSNYIPQYLQDVITFPCPQCLFLAQHSSNIIVRRILTSLRPSYNQNISLSPNAMCKCCQNLVLTHVSVVLHICLSERGQHWFR